ncbi:MAG: UvrD-helicase domain-containing protein [Aeromicrobium sp.]
MTAPLTRTPLIRETPLTRTLLIRETPLIRDEAHLCEVLDVPFSADQIAAVTAPIDKTQVIIAGAGSGKTTVMAARVVWLVGHEGVSPDKILGLTFTNKAAAELGRKIDESLSKVMVWPEDHEVGEPTTSTYHAFAGSLIAEHGLRLGVEPDLRIISDASRFQRMARVIETYDRPLELVSTHVPTLIGDVMGLDGQLSEHLVSTDSLRAFDTELIADLGKIDKSIALHKTGIATSQKRIELSHLVDRYRLAKREAGVMDFSDQMAWGAELAALPEVGEALRERFEVVLLDEYQDTSVAQRDLLKSLFSGADEESGRGHSVTAVGDPAQGIYGWRGAASGNLAEFLDHFPCLDGSRGMNHSLDVSRRCAKPIIDVANGLAAAYYATTDVVKPLRAAGGNGIGSVSVSLHHTVSDEIDHIVAEIADAHATYAWHDIAILVREGTEIGEIVKALRAANIPVEVVGLNGLLTQPEIQDILAVLEVVEDVTANPALLRLLSGPRWRIGPRDLVLLGQRAAELSGGSFGPAGSGELATELERAVEGTDPTEIVSLADALDDPGKLPYSDEARTRFGQLAALLRGLRSHVSEPLVDFTRRSIAAIDLDLELQIGPLGSGMDNIALLLDAIASYAETDSYASLRGLLAYLEAEVGYNNGMEVSAPSEADSVKLLTAHKAKGLEWACVFVPFMAANVFPSGQSRGLWISNARVLPVSLRGDRDTVPDIDEWSTAGVKTFRSDNREDALNEERRLGYVAFTRAKMALHVSGHWWGRTQKDSRGPSEFLTLAHEWLVSGGGEPGIWVDPPSEDETNPFLDQLDSVAWPASLNGIDKRRQAARLVRDSIAGHPHESPEPTGEAEEAAELASLEALADDIEILLEEAATAASKTKSVRLPAALSATMALRLAEDEARLLRELARPMPRQPSTAARFGTRFHAWVETHFGQQSLLDPSDLPGQGDADVADDAELADLIEAFANGPYGDSQPLAIEAPFSLVLGGQQVIGRIDAVYKTTGRDGEGYEVVDWKTNKAATADPLQLAIYRLAWAELQGIDPARVTGAFYYVRLGEVTRFDDLPGREQLQARLGLGAGS